MGGPATGNSALLRQPVPRHEHEPEVHIAPLAKLTRMVDPVVGRAHHHTSNWAEAPGEVGVGEGDKATICDKSGGRDSPAGAEHERRQQRRQVCRMDERVGPERCEHAHIFLGMVQSVEPPQGCEPMVRNVSTPVHGVDPDERDYNDAKTGDDRQPAQDHERCVPLDLSGKARFYEGKKRDDDYPEQREIGRVDDVGAGEHWSPDCGPALLCNEQGNDCDNEGGANGASAAPFRSRPKGRGWPGGHPPRQRLARRIGRRSTRRRPTPPSGSGFGRARLAGE